MKELFEALLAALRRGETAALCTILGASGSAPRGAGAKMAVFADGSTIGTVGGGSVELRTTEMAKEAILSKKSLIHGFSLAKDGRIWYDSVNNIYGRDAYDAWTKA